MQLSIPGLFSLSKLCIGDSAATTDFLSSKSFHLLLVLSSESIQSVVAMGMRRIPNVRTECRVHM